MFNTVIFQKNKNSFIAKKQISCLFGEKKTTSYTTLMELKNINNEKLMDDSVDNFYNRNNNAIFLQNERKIINNLLLPYEIMYRMRIYNWLGSNLPNLPLDIINLICSFGDKIDEISLFFISKGYKANIRDIKEKEEENFYITNNIKDLLIDLRS